MSVNNSLTYLLLSLIWNIWDETFEEFIFTGSCLPFLGPLSQSGPESRIEVENDWYIGVCSTEGRDLGSRVMGKCPTDTLVFHHYTHFAGRVTTRELVTFQSSSKNLVSGVVILPSNQRPCRLWVKIRPKGDHEQLGQGLPVTQSFVETLSKCPVHKKPQRRTGGLLLMVSSLWKIYMKRF